MKDLPAFITVPVAGGGEISAVVATSDGIAEVLLNGIPHIGLLLSVNMASATIAVMTPNEAARMAQQLSIAAVAVARRIKQPLQPERARVDVTNRDKLTKLHADDVGAHLWRVLDQTGAQVEDVKEVDCEAGWVLILNKDDDGKPIISGDDFTYRRVRGQYSIERVAV